MAGGIHHHHDVRSIDPREFDRRVDEHSDSSSSSSSSSSSAGSTAGFPLSADGRPASFNASRTASRAHSFVSRPSSPRPRASLDPMRPPNGDESVEQLLNIIAELQDQVRAEARPFYHAAREEYPAPPRSDAHGRRRSTSPDRARFEHLAARRAREEEQTRQEEEHADFQLARKLKMQERKKAEMHEDEEFSDFQLAHKLQMQEHKKAEMQAQLQDQMETSQAKRELSQLQQALNLLSKGNEAAEQLTRR